jgi:hypothetical protein
MNKSFALSKHKVSEAGNEVLATVYIWAYATENKVCLIVV